MQPKAVIYKAGLQEVYMSAVMDGDTEKRPTRGEVAEYVHDMAGQLAAMAEHAGLTSAAEALKCAQSAIEREF